MSLEAVLPRLILSLIGRTVNQRAAAFLALSALRVLAIITAGEPRASSHVVGSKCADRFP